MGELSQDAAALLRSGRAAFRPAASDRVRVLDSLRERLGEAAVAGEPGVAAHVEAGTGARGTAWKSLWVKAFGAVSMLAVGASVTIGMHLGAAPREPAPLAPAMARSTGIDDPTASQNGDTPSPPVLTETGPSPPSASRARSHRGARTGADSLAEEVRLLSAAERQLNEGSREGALATLADHERRFPRGALTEARVAVRVEALCGLGRMAEARVDLRRLAVAYPASPHLDAARKLCGADIDSP
jgi:hypothetical protein